MSASSATLKIGESQTHTASVTGTGNTAVDWSVAGAGYSGAACGTVTDGRCVAPASLPSNGVVTVTAASVVDPGKTAQATVTLGSGQIGQLVFYLVSPDRAVVMAAPDARVRAGMFERQQAAPYATANLIGPGRYVLLLQRQPGSRCDEVVQVNHAEP